MTLERLAVRVNGRPAPQGSKKRGAAGQLREQSPYLPAWRQAVRLAVLHEYKARGVHRVELPLFKGSVAIERLTFYLDTGQRIDGPPDIDKLTRAVLDAMTIAHVWEDDSRVVAIRDLSKVEAFPHDGPGAYIEVVPVGGEA